MNEACKYLDCLPIDIVSTSFKLKKEKKNVCNPKIFHVTESQNPRTKIFGLDIWIALHTKN